MPLLNYTTQVEASKTVGEIEKVLQAHKARSISKHYDQQGQITAVTFSIDSRLGPVNISLPVNVEAVYSLLIKEEGKKRGNYGDVDRDKALIIRKQSVRVAWRILFRWVEAQMAFLDTNMVGMDQIFLPYILTPSGKTIYQMFQERQPLLLQQGPFSKDEE